MGSRDRWSSGIDVPEVAMNIVAFEVMNNVRVELRLTTVDRNGLADIVIAALAHDRTMPIGEVAPLASVSVSCLGSRLRTMEAALIHALYQLDSTLDKNVLEEVKTK